jgi:hypothetical protein
MNKRNTSRTRQRRFKRSLPLIIILGGAALIALAIFALRPGRATIEVTGQAKLEADQEKVDLGTVRLGTPVTTQFVLTNVGDQPLVFSQEPFVEVIEGC